VGTLPPPPPGAPPGTAKPAGNGRTTALVVAGIVAAGAVATAVIATRGGGSPTAPTLAVPARLDPAPAPGPSVDPWATPASPIDGTRVSAGQGVGVIIPSGFRTADLSGYVAAQDSRGVMIMAGPIVPATNDPQQLAQYHARTNQLVFDSMDHVFVGGIRRPMAVFHGTVNGARVRHVAVPLIGPGYRIAVLFQAPDSLASDPAVQALELELFTRRITLP
jgi:hypothetical protein